MKIKMNGEEKQLEKEMNILEFLAVQQVEMPEMVSVELNGEIIDRDDFENTFIKEDDVIELLYFMGGGGFGF
ncbi:sulfur carrier protein ThiS [Clostridium formicaceticum]|uniref:Bifunctional sulfur carrier protein/thiazole synthase protein n=1 Tax=Clostridium formicaceticum TaxID=1497 RepID=A0AAC9WFL1_9CLOT|nr:sulfur carrier protein ThiS [Clostridium formicaceticum]AOY76512.1 thiamine biosynthesis protein ThiS [Clostridium formicaceticum]ARE86923.1 bifunctional sulfur carrier protein/thiazole synthase protein [Clostridium formicaceticum]